MLLKSCLPVVLFIVTLALANVEKIIFVAGDLSNGELSQDVPTFTLSEEAPSLRAKWQGQFPSENEERGRRYFGALRNLEKGRRYELRVCWPATSPSDFYLKRHLIKRDSTDESDTVDEGVSIFVQSTYFTSNITRIEEPDWTNVEIILDPYILNILPESLLSIGVYIICVAGFMATVAGWVVTLLKETHAAPWQIPDKKSL